MFFWLDRYRGGHKGIGIKFVCVKFCVNFSLKFKILFVFVIIICVIKIKIKKIKKKKLRKRNVWCLL